MNVFTHSDIFIAFRSEEREWSVSNLLLSLFPVDPLERPGELLDSHGVWLPEAREPVPQ